MPCQLNMEPIRIFISYAQANAVCLRKKARDRTGTVEKNPKDLLTRWRNGLQSECEVEFWHHRDEDEGPRGGDLWEKRIFHQIDRADVAVLLITREFVQSNFIRRREARRKKKRRFRAAPSALEWQTRGARVLCYVDYSPYTRA